MTTVTEIQRAIEELAESDYAELMRWIQERDWEKWDEELEEDVRAGRLDALAANALEAKARGELRDL